MATDVSSSVTLELTAVRESKCYEHRCCRQHRFSKFSRHRGCPANKSCLYNGRRTIVCVCACVTMAAESTTTTAVPTTRVTTTGASTTTTPTPSGTEIFINAPW